MHPREGWRDGDRPSIFGPSDSGPSRRNFLRTGRGLRGPARRRGSLLAACGSSGTSSTGASAIPLPRPNHPVTWPIFTGNKPIKSGLAPEKDATLKIYNWVAYINQAVRQRLRQEVQLQGPGVDVQHHGRGAGQDPQRPGRLRRLHGRHHRRARPAGRAEVHPAAEPQLHPEHHAGLARLHRTRSTTGKWQYTVPYTIYTTGIAWRKDHVPENPYTMANPWAMLVAVEVQGQGRDPRRLPRGHQPGPDEERHLRPEHHQRRPDHRRRSSSCRTSSS